MTMGPGTRDNHHDLKELLSSSPVLASPDFESMFTVELDASYNGLGATLTLVKGGNELVIAYAS